MLINVLICNADGTQRVESREVPEDWLGASTKAPIENSTNAAVK